MADPVSAAYIVGAVLAVGGTIQQVRVTNSQNRITDWQSEEDGRIAHLQSEERELERMEELRRTLAQNNVNAAVSGVSVNSGSALALKNSSIAQFEQDQLTDRTNTASYVDGLAAAAEYNNGMASMQNVSSIVNGLSTVASIGISANTQQVKTGE